MNENKTLVAHLTGPDVGPKSESLFSNWDKKVISTSSHRINIKFASDDAAGVAPVVAPGVVPGWSVAVAVVLPVVTPGSEK